MHLQVIEKKCYLKNKTKQNYVQSLPFYIFTPEFLTGLTVKCPYLYLCLYLCTIQGVEW